MSRWKNDFWRLSIIASTRIDDFQRDLLGRPKGYNLNETITEARRCIREKKYHYHHQQKEEEEKQQKQQQQ